LILEGTIKQSGIFVIVQSGLGVMTSISGQPVALVSGSQVGLSGLQVITQSGISVIISGQPVIISGQPIALVSGSQVGLSGLQVIIQSGIQVMGSIAVSVSGQPVALVSGTQIGLSGLQVIIAGGTSVSGQPVALTSGTVVIGQSGIHVVVQSGIGIVGSITSDISGQVVNIGQTLSGQALYVQISGNWSVINNTSIVADGSEQVLLNSTIVGEHWGFINLVPMLSGDVIVLRQYIYANGTAGLYREKTYWDGQQYPLLAVRPKPVAAGMKFTLQQNSGAFRTIAYNFNVDKTVRA